MLACLHGDSLEKVILLLEAYPEAASNERRDLSGRTCFEFACDNPRPIKEEFMRLILAKRSQLAVIGEGITSAPLRARSDTSMQIIAECEENEEVEDEAETIPPGTKICCICMDRAVSIALVPCGHTILCSGCGSRQGLTRIDHKCPECRSPVEQAIKIFARVADD